MRLFFDDEESFMETVESLRFNNPRSVSECMSTNGKQQEPEYVAPGLNEDNVIHFGEWEVEQYL